MCVMPSVMHKTVSFSAAWDGSSVWDLPIDSMAQAPTIEQMQQFEKAKNAKVILLALQNNFRLSLVANGRLKSKAVISRSRFCERCLK